MKDSKQPMNKPAPTGSRLTSLGSSALARSRSFLRTQYWIWPLIAAVILVFVGVFVRLQMEGAMKPQIAGNLGLHRPLHLQSNEHTHKYQDHCRDQRPDPVLRPQKAPRARQRAAAQRRES